MPYPEQLIRLMREDLTQHGLTETRTPEAVDQALHSASGTVLLVINSVCGCAAGKARPGVGLALQNEIRPESAITVFAGGDEEATAHVRSRYLADYPPSSPSVALFQDGKAVFYLHRSGIESRGPEEIAEVLTSAFEKFCAPANSLQQKVL
ncbi:MAG: BrxA/BrxB family bacilliredoxin [Bryobacteraceae bacterium]|nr:BrxA/BrxB family bacilliredoxin [Bryobacteraceae bacterium]